ncbi:hypothetical protein LCGC14_2275520 [marine sediment metagenome]|uniref:Uncharacterized protein n=1 Tax=marine sediment metagenome TaxID=412755 RepID=A0A0F9CVP4_9ZZZZ
MNPADKYIEELIDAIHTCYIIGANNDWEYAVLCEELDRVRTC